MFSDITIGQYYKENSFVHRLDARTKIILTVMFIAMLFMCKNFLSLALSVAFVIVSVFASRVPLRMFLKSLKPIVPVVIFTALLNMFYIGGEKVLFPDWKIRITEEGLLTAVFFALRIVFLIVSSSILTYTTVPTDLTDAIEKLLSPLKLLHIPVHSFAMMMTLALRFIPTLIEEIDRIMNAQKARGADLESGGIIQRAKALVPIFIPLMVSSFRRAYELAFAMTCRCYTGGEGRTRMKQMKLSFRDFAALVLCLAITAGVVVLNHFFEAVI